ncbi:contactin-associated protein like 5-3-like [Dendronephthya gigantea]|uniref:contactin-associated protein like 5-3-like n=1 Tax=Dendronephthya gigantea TaxID=151771 RepID=UPI00106C0130|nr:contactin-associated protein like 5-3-like [Dendronephthya gigantea]
MSAFASICALIFLSITLQVCECSNVQAFFRKKDGKYLANHVIETKQAKTELECSMYCVRHSSCVSVNYKISGIGKGRCELNSKTLQDTSDDDECTSDPEFKHLYIIKINSEPTSPSKTSRKISTGIFNRTDKSAPFETCTILRSENRSAESGKHFIKPRGINYTVPVFCNMTSKNGAGVTEIGHDSESRTFVTGYEDAGSYQRMIKYEISIDLIVAIMNQSKNCEQCIKYECYSSIFYTTNGEQFAWWVSRQGKKMNYWGGAAVDSGKCACGINNSCAGGGKCNCDKNDATWREDSGYLTDKSTLPVTELRFGDTRRGNETWLSYTGYITLLGLRGATSVSCD